MDRYRGSSRRSPLPRDRPPLRNRDNHPDVEYFGQGESYRPGGSAGAGPYRPIRERAPGDTWNAEGREERRLDERRGDDRRRDDIDSYIPPTSARAQRPRSRSPGGYRRRSRSPLGRGKELFPDRTRSPVRRYSPRRDERDRSPFRRRSRSPPPSRPRSPESKRPKEYTPDVRRSPDRERVSSPRGRYERLRSPPRRGFSPRDAERNSYRPRSRTPPRGGRAAYNDDNWRRRSPSPRASGPASNNTSRRSSPPPHVDRMSLPGSLPRSPAYPKAEPIVHRARSPQRHTDRSKEPSPPQLDRDSIVPPTGPASQRNGLDRPPPTGPSRTYDPSSTSPPTGPANQVLMATHNRGPGSFAAPTQPRGAPVGRFSGPSRDYANPALRGRSSLTYRAPGLRPSGYSDVSSPPAPAPGSTSASTPPAGPRAGSFAPPRGDFSARGGYGGYGRGDHQYSHNFRSTTSSTSTTYPRTQRFNSTSTNTVQAHLGTLEKIVPGGKKLPSGVPPEQERRLKMLELEAERMRENIREKQHAKREAIIEWDTRQREVEREALRSELAEEALSKLQDNDGLIGGAAF